MDNTQQNINNENMTDTVTENVSPQNTVNANVTDNDILKYYMPPKTRRVGTFTLGLTLVAIGSIAIHSVIFQKFNFTLLSAITPFIFISLGIEILIASFFANNKKLKYDFLSMFIAFCLVIFSGVALIIPNIIQYLGPQNSINELKISRHIEDVLYNNIPDKNSVKDLNILVSVNPFNNTDTETDVNNLDYVDFVRIDLTLEDTENIDEFVNKSREFAVLTNKNFPTAKLYIDGYTADKSKFFSINFSSKFNFNADIDILKQRTEEKIWDKESERYMPKAEYEKLNITT